MVVYPICHIVVETSSWCCHYGNRIPYPLREQTALHSVCQILKNSELGSAPDQYGIAEKAACRGELGTFGSFLLADLQSQSSNDPVESSSDHDSFSNAPSACQINFIWQNLSLGLSSGPNSVLET